MQSITALRGPYLCPAQRQPSPVSFLSRTSTSIHTLSPGHVSGQPLVSTSCARPSPSIKQCAYAPDRGAPLEPHSIVQVFRGAGVSDEHVARAYKLCPALLRYPVERVSGTLAFLAHDIRLGPAEIGKVLVRHPEVFSYSLEHRLAPAAAFLREELALGPDGVRDVVTRWPVIFSYNVRAQLKPQLAYLQSLGVAADMLPSLVLVRPLVLGEGIESVVRFLKRAGVPRTQVYRLLASYPLDYGLAFERYAGGGAAPARGLRLDGPFSPPSPSGPDA